MGGGRPKPAELQPTEEQLAFDGYLACVEIVRYLEFLPDDPPFAAFIEGAAAIPSRVLHSVKPPGYWIPYSRP